MKNRLNKIIICVTAVFILSVLLGGCAFNESANSFRGGELLDEDMMSELKESVLAENGSDLTETGLESLSGSNVDSETVADSVQSNEDTAENDGESETVNSDGTLTEETEKVAESEIGKADTVYWVKGGSVWHLSRDCYHLRNKDVISGSVEEAQEAGKTKVCSNCSK